MPDIENYISSFEHSYWRRPFMIIVGATNFGKTALGRHVLQRVGGKLSLTTFLEVPMEEDAHIDFSTFRVQEHAGVLLDGVAD
eukprot:3307641-Karenia_brevis.AAC.1